MILECPSCSARYLVQIGLFAQGGRQVRCARCKNEWHAKLPTSIDVVMPPPGFEAIPEVVPAYASSSAPPQSYRASVRMPPVQSVVEEPALDQAGHPIEMPEFITNLPAVIKKGHLLKKLSILCGYAVLGVVLIAWPILDRKPIVKIFPGLAGFYDAIGLHVPPAWDGLLFNQVKSELKYDSGTMKLYVDGVIHNSTPEIQLIPDIKANAIGPDGHIIQSWWVEAPASTIEPDADVPFHTEVASPMEHTIENVNLEFFARDVKTNANK